jgi:hypothetical protein
LFQTWVAVQAVEFGGLCHQADSDYYTRNAINFAS